MHVNEQQSGGIDGIGLQKFKVTIEGDTRDDVSSTAARNMAMKCAAANGFAQSGLCDSPVIGLLGPDNVPIETSGCESHERP